MKIELTRNDLYWIIMALDDLYNERISLATMKTHDGKALGEEIFKADANEVARIKNKLEEVKQNANH